MSKKPTKEVDLIAELEAVLSESTSKEEEPPTDVKEPAKALPFWQQNVVVEAPIWLPK